MRAFPGVLFYANAPSSHFLSPRIPNPALTIKTENKKRGNLNSTPFFIIVSRPLSLTGLRTFDGAKINKKRIRITVGERKNAAVRHIGCYNNR